MYVQVIQFSLPLSNQDSHRYKNVRAKEGGISGELNKIFEAGLADNATDPRAKVVHLLNATIGFSTMMCSVRLEIPAL